MTKLNTLLRRLEPWQIVTVGVIAWLACVAVVAFGLAPLAAALFLGAGEAASSVVRFAVCVLGGVAVGWYVPKPFMAAYMDARMDRALERLYAAFAEAKQNNG